jgi:Peptidase family M28
MFRPALVLALLLAARHLSGQQIHFTPIDRKVVQDRFSTLPLKNGDRASMLRELFAAARCDGDRYREQAVKGSKLPNLLCTLPGSSDETVIVSAHYDKVDRDGSQGAVDNWSSASLLPSLYEALAARPRRLTMAFIGFTDEEVGLVGSTFYSKSLSRESLSKIAAVVNMDSIGMTSTKVWVSRADKELLRDTALVARALNLQVDGVNVERVGDSDSHPFAARKLRVIDFHSVTQENLRVLHSGRDQPSAINWDAYYDTYRLIAGLLAYLDAASSGESQEATAGGRQ